MQLQHGKRVPDPPATNRHFSRRPLITRSWRSALPGPHACPCGRPVVGADRSHRRQQALVVSAATATTPRGKAAPKKRKQVEPLLVVENVSKTHDGQRFLFEGLDFTVSRGDRLALVGPNGAGKSSLFNLLSGTLCLVSQVCAFLCCQFM